MLSTEARCEARYKHLEPKRTPYVVAAEACAALTIPSVFPPLAGRDNPKPDKALLVTPWQNIGSRGVNNLASKLLLTLLPPDVAFFKMLVDERIKERIAAGEVGDPDEAQEQLDRALQIIERSVLDDIEASGLRVDAYEVFKHLIITGNYCLLQEEDGRAKGFDLGMYVCRRDRRGMLLELVIREGVDLKSADERVAEIIKRKVTKQNDDPVFLYTHVELTANGRYHEYQEVCGEIVPGSEANYPADRLPYMVLRFRKVEGEDYGRGLVEENIGDLKSLESLTMTIVTGSAAMAKILYGVKPGSPIDVKKLAKKKSGEFFGGNEGDIWTLKTDKQMDLAVAQRQADKIEEQLKFVFLLNSAIQRSGERVTAEEIRYMAGELEDGLGGVYSILTQEFQQPLVKHRIAILQRRGVVPFYNEEELKPTVITGLEAIGRQRERNRIRAFLDDATVLGTIDPSVPAMIDSREVLVRLGVSHGVDLKLVKSVNRIQQEQEAARAQAIQDAATQEAMRGVGKGAEVAAANLANTAMPAPQGGGLPQ
jgi:hypothetical protein